MCLVAFIAAAISDILADRLGVIAVIVELTSTNAAGVGLGKGTTRGPDQGSSKIIHIISPFSPVVCERHSKAQLMPFSFIDCTDKAVHLNDCAIQFS